MTSARDPLPVAWGRLAPAADAPASGETSRALASCGSFAVEQILSGRLGGPVAYAQDHDEWVVLLAGGAELEVDGRAVTLAPGDWVLLPAGTAHRLLDTRPGSSWLAVRGAADPTG